jgi:hypothetical protein
MKTCPSCGKEIQEEVTRCPHCGSDVARAPSIGPPIPPGAPAPPPPHTSRSGGPTTASPPQASGEPLVGQGALRYSHAGDRYILGYGVDFFGIWDRAEPGEAVAVYPRSDEGWAGAWNRFIGLEPRSVSIPQAGMAPDLRAPTRGYRSGHLLANWVVALLAVASLVALIRVIFTLMELDLLRAAEMGNTPSLSAAEASDRRLALLGVATLLVIVPTIVMWVVWQYRAHSNLPALGAANLRYRPGWVVGWWFIPVANLAIPYLTMRELHKASDPEAGAVEWKAKRTSPLLWLWWGAWLGQTALNGISSTLAFDPDAPIGDYIASDYFSIAGDIAYAVAGALAILLVRSIDDRQRRMAHRVSGMTPVRSAAW